MIFLLTSGPSFLAPMQSGLDDHGCGLVSKSNEIVEAIVAGCDHGVDTVEILDIATLTWR